MRFGKLRATLGLSAAEGVYVYQILPVESHLVAVSSDDTVRSFDPTTQQEIFNGRISDVHVGITKARTSKRSPQTLITAGRDAQVKAWDLRSGAQTVSYQDGDDAPYLSLDCNNSYMAAGSELTNHQAAVSIWDYRNPSKPIRKYVESHSDDVTDLAFHTHQSNILLSGSTDSLINIYNTNVADEDDTLLQISNHGSSIHHAGFLDSDSFFGLSHDETLSLYHYDPTQEEPWETTDALALGDLREELSCEYVVDVISCGDEKCAIVAAGSCSHQRLDLVQLFYEPRESTKFAHEYLVRLEGAHGTEIVRSFYIEDGIVEETIYTAGEDGCIKVWGMGPIEEQLAELEAAKQNAESSEGGLQQDVGDEDGGDEDQDHRVSAKGKVRSTRFKPY